MQRLCLGTLLDGKLTLTTLPEVIATALGKVGMQSYYFTFRTADPKM